MAEYESEQKSLKAAVSATEQNLAAFAEDSVRAERFLEVAKRYTDYSELTTQMLNEFIDKIIIHKPEKIDGDRVVEVDIYFRFIGNFELPPRELTPEEIKREEQLHRHRVKSRERYQKIKAGEHAVGQPFQITCKCCGKTFGAKTTAAMFCGRNCRAKYYRQEAAKERSREIDCAGCGKTFTTTRVDVKYCCEACRLETKKRDMAERRAASKEQGTA